MRIIGNYENLRWGDKFGSVLVENFGDLILLLGKKLVDFKYIIWGGKYILFLMLR